MILSDLLVVTFTQLLRALGEWLEKGAGFEEGRGRSGDELMNVRLAPDMYPLAGQVLFCCFMSQEAIYKYRGQDLPAAIEELRRMGWASGEQPGTFAQAKARIKAAIDFLDGVQAGELDGASDRRLELVLPTGLTLDMSAQQYARDWTLPQFYFHLMTAYAILRCHGVPLGKKDYVPYLWQYVRPETAPQG
jgi:hypothetical protein